jgi:hypothetical protein
VEPSEELLLRAGMEKSPSTINPCGAGTMTLPRLVPADIAGTKSGS